MANENDQPEATNETEAAEKAGQRREMDPEVRVLGQILRIIDELPEDARVRVVAFIASRYKS